MLYYKRLTRGTFDLSCCSTEKGVYELD
ncbi:hypothetical protein FH721_21230 [Bacteroides thetaiotaomicron]|uniref:Uncharacterized protein n=1 Tax=Bacteroides thetaiotaomicron TaxID=818 RepID=A0A6I0TA37_BACT4|nr:hypothetical protein GAN55_13370 [Bacteroides thetaiotaomicron]KAB4475362.1 hypothetical protein GAN91_22010 [Bacteroides thetaiotaomicron]KAB4519320.1 hypothetical protein GAO00_06085 [Bacteroides thetaiotaomicron]MBI0303720.1 hypothetical protein [Bacteroides thetaiotaomicron]MBL3930595.1 hypothetical protein [Bacteroides thetaiotaomicron]